MKPTEIVSRLLANATDLKTVKELVAEDATYVSLNYENADLKKIEPWCGTHPHAGPEAIHQTFVSVNKYWEVLSFAIHACFGEGGDVAVFGRFKYESRTLKQITDSPFAVWAKVDVDRGLITYMQFMEDTLSTAASFRKSGTMVYASDPDGGEVVIGE